MFDTANVSIFAGSGGQVFAERMCKYMGKKLGSSEVITFSEGKTSSRVNIPHFENVIVTDLGTVYDFDGNKTNEAPLNTPLVTITPPDGLPVASKIYENIDGAMSLFAESGLKVLLALQKAGSSEPIILDYYAEEAIVTKDGCMIVYTPNSYGLLLVKLP